MNAVITACILMTGALVASCSNDDAAPDNAVATKGEPVSVTVTINQASAGTRASSTLNPASDNEIKVGNRLAVFVFDATPGSLQLLESTHAVEINVNGTADIPATPNATSKAFTITSGKKFFYIFANADEALEGRKGTFTDGVTYLRSLALPGSTHADFKKNILQGGTLSLIAELGGSGKFLIGTLWEGVDETSPNWRNVPVNTSNTPTPITGLQVGRLVSKVSFLSSAPFEDQFKDAADVGGKLAGTWDKVKWRIVNQPDQMYLVGNWEKAFPGNTGAQVKTPFFNKNEEFWDVNGNFANSRNKTDFEAVPSRYTLENTHGGTVNNDGVTPNFPRKGNTTAVQFEAQFIPTASATYNPIADGATFWAAKEADGSYTFYNNTSSTAPTGAIKYTNGLVYYLAYITDTSEGNASAQYAVLRNHQYILEIASIKELGDNDSNPFNKPDGQPGGTDEPKPIDPIETETSNITIAIQVLNWNRIDQKVEWK